eukprot:4072521-Pleurochrysis_carterae.AAC.1
MQDLLEERRELLLVEGREPAEKNVKDDARCKRGEGVHNVNRVKRVHVQERWDPGRHAGIQADVQGSRQTCRDPNRRAGIRTDVQGSRQ